MKCRVPLKGTSWSLWLNWCDESCINLQQTGVNATLEGTLHVVSTLSDIVGCA